MGRPPKGTAPRTKVLQVRLTTAEHRMLKRLAKEESARKNKKVNMADLLMGPFRPKED